MNYWNSYRDESGCIHLVVASLSETPNYMVCTLAPPPRDQHLRRYWPPTCQVCAAHVAASRLRDESLPPRGRDLHGIVHQVFGGHKFVACYGLPPSLCGITRCSDVVTCFRCLSQ